MKHFQAGWLRMLWAAVLALWISAGPIPAGAQVTDQVRQHMAFEDLKAFRDAPENWTIRGNARADRQTEHALSTTQGEGLLVNRADSGDGRSLRTNWTHGDLVLELDFMMSKDANSGLFLQGRYELQLVDSWGKAPATYADVGGIAPRRTSEERELVVGGKAPRLNAGRAPGLWQHLRVEFKAPEFDDAGNKVKNARFARVLLNGVTIHEDVAVTGPTRGASFTEEASTGPLVLQGDGGPLAIRNVTYKRVGDDRLRFTNIHHALFKPTVCEKAKVKRYMAPRYTEFQRDTIAAQTELTDTLTAIADGIAKDRYAGCQVHHFVGQLRVPVSGSYQLELRSAGRSRLRIGSETVVDHDGSPLPSDSATAAVTLSPGTHPFVLSYGKTQGGMPVLKMFAEGPGMPRHELTAPPDHPEHHQTSATVEIAADDRPVIRRCFIPFESPDVEPALIDPDAGPHHTHGVQHVEKKGNRTMPGYMRGAVPGRTHAASVGDPADVHYSVDLQQGALLRAWKGPFADVRSMWIGRGFEQQAQPLGSVVSFSGGPTVAFLESMDDPWPKAVEQDRYDLRGYTLNREGRPTFTYRLGPVTVEDHLTPLDGHRGLKRVLVIAGDAPSQSQGRPWVRLAEGSKITRLDDGSYNVGGRYYVDPTMSGAAELTLRTQGEHEELLWSPPLKDQAQIEYSILW